MSILAECVSPGKAPHRFCVGFLMGMVVASLIAAPLIMNGDNYYRYRTEPVSHVGGVSRMAMQEESTERSAELWSERSVLDREPQDIRDPASDLDTADRHLHRDDNTVAQRLTEEVRVLVWVMTSPQTLQSRAKMIRDTWGKRTNKILFFSSKSDPDLPAIGLNVTEGRTHLMEKTNRAFRYIYDNHMDDADWFMKVDDDTYVIMENLRYLLSGENSSEPLFLGHHFHLRYRSRGAGTMKYLHYQSGGAGYVISKEALRRFGEKGRDEKLCRQTHGAEDIGFGQCMINLGVRISNSTDVLGRSRFHCFPPGHFTGGRYPSWYHAYDANGARKGVQSMSDYAVTFHYIRPSEMQTLDYLIYHLRPYGVLHALQNLNREHNTTSLPAGHSEVFAQP
ncbi:glycoprotein-N-acetylgalactosamine 3-beta-galactosyltransferase 1-like [Littorina saxatilis]